MCCRTAERIQLVHTATFALKVSTVIRISEAVGRVLVRKSTKGFPVLAWFVQTMNRFVTASQVYRQRIIQRII